jgi:hypothetical protein
MIIVGLGSAGRTLYDTDSPGAFTVKLNLLKAVCMVLRTSTVWCHTVEPLTLQDSRTPPSLRGSRMVTQCNCIPSLPAAGLGERSCKRPALRCAICHMRYASDLAESLKCCPTCAYFLAEEPWSWRGRGRIPQLLYSFSYK